MYVCADLYVNSWKKDFRKDFNVGCKLSFIIRFVVILDKVFNDFKLVFLFVIGCVEGGEDECVYS